MKNYWIALILIFIGLSAFAIKRKRETISNVIPEFIVREVDNRMGVTRFVQYNDQYLPLQQGTHVIMLPIDFTPSTRNPHKEFSKYILFNFNSHELFGTHVAILFQLIKEITPRPNDPNILNVKLVTGLYYIDVDQQSRTLINKKEHTYMVHRNDQDNYFFDIVLSGSDFSQSSVTVSPQVNRGQ